jgi:hypothetical protein
MKKNIVPLFLLLAFTYTSKAQYRGFSGKRFVVKTTIMDGKYVPCRNVEAEFGLTRRLSISLGYQFYESNKVGQRLDGGQKLYYNDNSLYNSGLNEHPYPSNFENKAYVRTSTIYYMVKVYTNKILPAPNGFFFYWQNGFGKGTFSGNNYDPNVGVVPFVETKVPIMNYGFGIGNQVIIGKLITLDLLFGFSGAVVKDNGTGSQYNTNLIAPHWGSNLFSYTSATSLKPPLTGSGYYSSDGLTSYDQLKPRSGSFGMDFRIKLGLLLF